MCVKRLFSQPCISVSVSSLHTAGLTREMLCTKQLPILIL